MSNTRADFTNITLSRPCTSCKGTGMWEPLGAGCPARRCASCSGKGSWPGLDLPTILAHIFSKRGGLRMLKSFPSKLDRRGPNEGRAYYIWRLARFHGGADVTMPMTADMVSYGDPYRAELDAISEAVARKVFGTNMAAAYRWAGALGYNVQVPADQPASAFPGGPAYDALKPAWEALERR